jgi:hypothetical protein
MPTSQLLLRNKDNFYHKFTKFSYKDFSYTLIASVA